MVNHIEQRQRSDRHFERSTVFAGIYGDGVFRSTDNGENWTQVNNGLTATFVLSFTTNASEDVFAGTYFGGGVFRSSDTGETWSEKTMA